MNDIFKPITHALQSNDLKDYQLLAYFMEK